MAQETFWDLNQVISRRLPGAKIFGYLKTPVEHAHLHHKEAFAALFLDRVFFVQKKEFSPADGFLGRVQRVGSELLPIRWTDRAVI